MRWLASAFAAGAILLAGCLGANPPGPDLVPFSDDSPISGPLVSESQGAIRGRVLDDSIAPVANATVVLETTGARPEPITDSTTDDVGEFFFSLVEPGTYRVHATYPGFSEAAVLLLVAANEISETRLTLTARPTEVPYVELRILNGVTGCDSWGLIVTFIVIGGTCPTAQGPRGLRLSVPESWRYGIWELDWRATSEFLGFLVSPNIFTCDTLPCYGVSVGPPPLKLYAEPEKKMQNETPFYHAPSGGILAYPKAAFNTSIGAYHGGLLGRQTTEVMRPTHYCPEYCYGAATSLETRFTVYASVFHFQAPPDPKSYTAMPDQ